MAAGADDQQVGGPAALINPAAGRSQTTCWSIASRATAVGHGGPLDVVGERLAGRLSS